MFRYANRRNPILPLDIHTPDCEAHVFSDGKLHVYGSLDKYNGTWCSEEHIAVSTPDMKTWEISGVCFSSERIPWRNDPIPECFERETDRQGSPFVRRMNRKSEQTAVISKAGIPDDSMTKNQPFLYAPDCIEKDGKYYMLFDLSSGAEGIAVSDSPDGPFRDPVQLPCKGIDPAAFIDTDGQAYYYWGQFRLHGAKMNDSMTGFVPDSIADNLVTEEEHFFHEGSSMRRIGNTYYLVYTSIERGKANCLSYATSSSPLGPFIYRGVIIDNQGCDPQTWNNHGSIECFNGQWYVFYHRSSRNSKFWRRLCIEKIRIREDGTIPEVPMTSQGIGGPFGSGEKIMGYQACALKGGCYIDEDSAHGEKLTGIRNGDSAVFRFVRSTEPWKTIELEAAGKGKVQVFMNGTRAGTLDLTGGKSTGWLDMPAGEYELELCFEAPEGMEIYSLTLY